MWFVGAGCFLTLVLPFRCRRHLPVAGQRAPLGALRARGRDEKLPRARKFALWVTTGFILGLAAGSPAEPLDVSPAWEHPVTYVPNKQYPPGIRIGYPASLADRYSR